jgi:cysteine desulfurase/selenocysteine lyase
MAFTAPGTDHTGDPDDLTRWQQALRSQFPIIVNHPELVYLDSAATAQKPQAVLDAVRSYLVTGNANAGRGAYPWANASTELVERTRDRIKAFLHDQDPGRSTVHFTSGTTEALRSVARDWLPHLLADGDEIIVPFADHQANLQPWQEAQLALAQRGVHVQVRNMPYQASSGDYDLVALAEAVGPRTRFVATTHLHHVYGAHMNVSRIREVVGPDVVICLDAAQSVGHLPVDVEELDVDFVAFSGHKALALPGSGAVWARQARGPRFAPGGWSGTPNTTGIVSLATALDWLDAAGPDRIERWTTALAAQLTDALRQQPAYEIVGCQRSLALDTTVQQRCGIVTFRHQEISASDLGFILFSHGFMVRTDGHCQGSAGEPTSSVRVSTHVYNTPAEIERLVDVLTGLQ